MNKVTFTKWVTCRLGYSLFLVLLVLLSRPACAAIRLGQPQSASGEIDLGRIPDAKTTVFLRIRPSAWRQFVSTQQPASRILDQIAGSMDSSTASILKICFAPAVDEFIIAKWPSRYSWDVEQAVWMIGLELAEQTSTETLANALIASCSLAQDSVHGRKLRGYPLSSLVLPGRQLHLLRGEHHLLISPNLFLIQGYLASLDCPPEPPSASRPDALIGWRPGSMDSSRSQAGASSDNYLKGLGIDHFEASIQSLPMGLELRLTAKSITPNRNNLLFRPLNPDLLDSIPPDSDLIIAGGGLDLLGRNAGVSPESSPTVDRPYAFGIAVPEEERSPPKAWKIGGAVEREVAVANSPAPVSAEIAARLGGLLDDLGPLGRDMKQLQVEDRILFGDAAQRGSAGPEPQGLKDHFAEIARESVLAGMVSPNILVLPLYWDTLLTGASEQDQAFWTQREWREELAPIEFSLNQKREGLEIRLFSASPASYVMLLADLLFFAHIDYAGEWDRLFEEWERMQPTREPASPPVQ